MNYEEFKAEIVDDLKEELYQRGYEGVDISFRDVVKANETYESMTVQPADSRIGININIEEFFGEYSNGASYFDVLNNITELTLSAVNQMPNVNIEDLHDYSKMKETLSVEVISKEANQELLANVPHKDMEDMAVIYRFVLSDGAKGMQSITVTNEIMENYGITADQLHADALANAPQTRPAVIMGISEILKELMGPEMFEAVRMSMEPNGTEMMYVATTSDKINGAGIMVYPEFLEQAAEKLDGSYFILPSSRHEIILVADDGAIDFRMLKEMVEQVNATEVSPRDKLTDNVYHYDSEAKVFELAADYEDRKNAREESDLGEHETDRGSVLKDLDAKKKDVADRPANSKDAIDRIAKAKGGEAL